jgi:hypothetical protein
MSRSGTRCRFLLFFFQGAVWSYGRFRGWVVFADLSTCDRLWLMSRVGKFARTETYPTGGGAYFGGTDHIVALRVYGTEMEFPLLMSVATQMLGRDEQCQVHVDLRYIAEFHARIERLPASHWLRITNLSAKNPIVFEKVAYKESKEFYVQAGQEFRIGDTRFVAISEEMRISRPTILEVLGPKRLDAIDDVLITAASEPDRHLVIVAEPGNEQERFGNAIHTCSLRRRKPYKVLAREQDHQESAQWTVSAAREGTLLVWLPRGRRFAPSLVPAVIATEARLRLIFCTPSLGKLASSFPASLIGNAKEIEIPPLRARKDEIPRLLDHLLVSNLSQLRFADMADEVQQKLTAYRWKRNLQELHEAAGHLIKLAHYTSERQAARDSDMTRGKSRSWRKRLRLPLPIISETSVPSKKHSK